MKSRTGPRILTTVAVLLMVAAGVGFVVTMILNAFVFDEYDKYGEVPIPGSSNLHLPAGQVRVTFHTTLIGGGGGSGLPVPPLKYRINGPGGADATLTEDYGSTTIVNNDARVRIGYLAVPVDGDYHVDVDGKVGAYLDPTLAFGRNGGYGSLPWILGAVFGFGVVDLIVARIWASTAKRSTPSIDYQSPPPTTIAYQPPAAFTPNGEGVRLEQLNTLARLRDSGALTEDEYAAEKKRVLDGL